MSGHDVQNRVRVRFRVRSVANFTKDTLKESTPANIKT